MKALTEIPRPRTVLAAVALAAAGLAAGPGAPADWPMFRGDPLQSGAARGDLPRQLVPRWTFRAEEGFESTAAIHGGVAYVGSLDGRLYAVDLETGALRFRYQAGGEIKSSPTVHDGTVYFGDEGGTFHAVDAATGARRWTFRAGGGIVSSANVAGDRLLFGSYDNFLYCVKAADGALAWKVETGGYVHATPAILERGGETLVASAGCDGLLRLLRAADGSEVRRVELGGYVAATPAVRGDRAFLGTFENQVLGIDLQEGKVLWTYRDPERQFPFYASAAVGGDLVIVAGRDRQVHALRPGGGELIWKHAAGARIDASPVIAGDRVVVATGSGELLALDLRTGDEVFRFETGSSFSASPSVAGGTLVIGDLDGTLYGFGGANPGKAATR
jgi:outer membrane protein assembly factor BamB